MPACRHISRSPARALAVRAMIGWRGRPRALSRSRILLAATRPSITGICTSISTRSKLRWRRMSSASRPLPAWVTWQPRRFRICSRIRRFVSLSSTISTRAPKCRAPASSPCSSGSSARPHIWASSVHRARSLKGSCSSPSTHSGMGRAWPSGPATPRTISAGVAGQVSRSLRMLRKSVLSSITMASAGKPDPSAPSLPAAMASMPAQRSRFRRCWLRASSLQTTTTWRPRNCGIHSGSLRFLPVALLIGKAMENSEPWPRVLSTLMLPSIRRTRSWTMARPRPLPPKRRLMLLSA